MANNRIYLVYRPTGDAVFLGKRLNEGYHHVPINVDERIRELFQRAADHNGAGDGFCLVFEDARNAPMGIDEDGIKLNHIGLNGQPINPPTP